MLCVQRRGLKKKTHTHLYTCKLHKYTGSRMFPPSLRCVTHIQRWVCAFEHFFILNVIPVQQKSTSGFCRDRNKCQFQREKTKPNQTEQSRAVFSEACEHRCPAKDAAKGKSRHFPLVWFPGETCLPLGSRSASKDVFSFYKTISPILLRLLRSQGGWLQRTSINKVSCSWLVNDRKEGSEGEQWYFHTLGERTLEVGLDKQRLYLPLIIPDTQQLHIWDGHSKWRVPDN